MSQRGSPLARRTLADAGLAPIITGYRPGITERLFTNPHGGQWAPYPCPVPIELARRYAVVVDLLEEARPPMEAGPSRVEGRASMEAGPSRVEGRASIDPEGVLFTAGSIAGIDLLVRCFCEPGEDRVCVSTPTFPAFAQYARFHGVEVVDVPLEGRDFNVLRTEAMSALGAKLTFVCTPNNPVGTTVAAEQVLELVQRSRGLVVVDEAYVELADVGSFARLVSRYPNLVVLRTFSKAWGLAGLRAGVVIAAPDVVHTLRIVQDPFACTAPVQAALARELHRVGELRAVLARLRAERAALVAALTRSPAVEYVYPTSTNFVLVRLRRPDAVYAALEREPDVFAANAHAHVPGTLKVSMGRPDNDARLLSFLQAHG